MNLLAGRIRYGVELECYMPRDAAADVPNHGAIPMGPHGWKGKPDGSLLTAPSDGMYGVEVVSPIERGENGLVHTWYMIEHIRSLGADVNATCGLHIHFDAVGLTEAEVQKIGAAFQLYEMAFFGLNGEYITERLQNMYCAHSLRWGGWGTAKYQSLNRLNYGGPHARGKSTLEFRLYRNTLDPAMVTTAIYMGAALWARALRDDTPIASGRYAEPRAALDAFVNDHYSDPRNLIIDVESADDLISKADELMLAAERKLRRAGARV